MAAYVFDPKDGGADAAVLPLPATIVLKDGSTATCERFRADSTDVAQGHAMLNEVIRVGQTYPYLREMDEAGFRAYFLSHDGFVCHQGDKVLGIFYVKPNFPGRCSHIANGGFITAPEARGNGVARGMATVFLKVAAALKYRAVMFNLVFVTNKPSLHLWDSLGFTRLAVIPQAGNLEGLGFTDAVQFYKALA